MNRFLFSSTSIQFVSTRAFSSSSFLYLSYLQSIPSTTSPTSPWSSSLSSSMPTYSSITTMNDINNIMNIDSTKVRNPHLSQQSYISPLPPAFSIYNHRSDSVISSAPLSIPEILNNNTTLLNSSNMDATSIPRLFHPLKHQ